MMEALMPLINQYGYFAIFVFLFLQEVGAPTPLPNEIVLMVSGYLIHCEYLSFFGVLMMVILSDFSAALVLYILFYFFGSWFLKSKPKWVPIPTRTILKLNRKITERGVLFVFLGRLTPFIRGYVAVISGLTHLKFRKYIVVVLVTTTIWGLFYVAIGYVISPYWRSFEPYLPNYKYVFATIFLFLVVVILFKKTSLKLLLKP